MQPPGKLSGTREVSEREGIPSSFLSKVLLQLRRGRLLRSYKGIGGGYELALPPHKISLSMVVSCFDGTPFNACILGDHECLAGPECPLHQSWGPVRKQLIDFLERTTLAELVENRYGHHVGSPDSASPSPINPPMEQ
jgi:Rrf2 family protein